MKMSLFALVVVVALTTSAINEVGADKLNVIYAVNAGGDKFQDSDGITYQKDPATQGIESDFGLRLDIQRVNPHDAALYQTERYAHSSFGYDIPIKEDGDYVLVVKFAEVYFRSPGQKVFDVVLNSAHLVIPELDIYATVGFATAHDEIIPFRVSEKGNKLTVGEHSSEILRGKVRLEFMKGYSDNPKVNAFYVIKGSIEDVPRLEPPTWEEPQGEEDEIDEGEMMYGDDEEDIHFSRSDLGHEADLRHGSINNVGGGRRSKVSIRSGIPSEDPWDNESALVVYLPLAGSVAASAVSFLIVRFFVSDKYY